MNMPDKEQMKGLSPDKLRAYYLLKRGFNAICKNAERVRKTIDQYLLDLRFDPEVVRFVLQEMQGVTRKSEKITSEPKEEQPEVMPLEVPESHTPLLRERTRSIEDTLRLLCMIVFVVGVFFVIYFL